jgi:hypothetical protein
MGRGEYWMKTSPRTKDSDYKDHGVIVKDIDEYNRRMKIIQSRIDSAHMLGLGTSEYEKRLVRPVHLEKSWLVGSEDDKTQVRVHTIQQSKSKEGNLTISIDADVWEK